MEALATISAAVAQAEARAAVGAERRRRAS